MLIDLAKSDTEIIPAEKYLKLTPQEKSNIASSKIVPAHLGSSSFGKMRVTYLTPTYKAGLSNEHF